MTTRRWNRLIVNTLAVVFVALLAVFIVTLAGALGVW